MLFAQRFAGLLMVAGAALTAILAVLFGPTTGASLVEARDVLFPLCALVAAAGVLFLLARPIPRWLLHLTPAVTALLICVPPAVAGLSTPAGELLLVWPMLFAAYLLPEKITWMTLAVCLTGFAVVAARVNSRSGAGLWVEMASALVLTTLVVITLRRRVDRLSAALTVQATHDPLTALPNRRSFDDVLAREVGLHAHGRRPLSLLMVDADHFKTINDTFGHPAGDMVLRRLAEALKTGIRAEDLLARIGGEEFAILLPGRPTPQAYTQAELLRRGVAASLTGRPGPVTVSIGIATLPDNATSPATLLAAADTALYAAKAAGRDTVAVSTTEPD